MTRAARADQAWTPRELRSLRALRSPWGIQRALDAMPYHLTSTAWSPRRVLREGTAHCLEGAIFAAAALRVLGFPPLLLDLEAVQDTDHVLAVFRAGGHWGAIGKSNFSGLRFRPPVHRTLRELAMSYFESYINLRGDRTLRAFSRPVHLGRFDRTHPGWTVTEGDLWFIPEYLVGRPHTPLLTPAMVRALTRVDGRSLRAGVVGFRASAGPDRLQSREEAGAWTGCTTSAACTGSGPWRARRTSRSSTARGRRPSWP